MDLAIIGVYRQQRDKSLDIFQYAILYGWIANCCHDIRWIHAYFFHVMIIKNILILTKVAVLAQDCLIKEACRITPRT